MKRDVDETVRAVRTAGEVEAGRRRGWGWRVPGLLLALLALLAWGGAGCKPPAPPPPPMQTVQVLEVTTTNLPRSVEFIGQLDSPENVQIRARVEAFVDQMLFTEGTEVKAGDPLFKLDDRPYRERLTAAEAGLAEALAALKKYEADVARLQPLAAQRAVPKQDLDNALASVDVGKASVESAQARVQSAQLDLSYCDVRAPISGLIGAKEVSIGDLVGKGQPTLLATISTLDPIWFYCNVSGAQYIRAEEETRRRGKRLEDVPVTLTLVTDAVHPHQGKVVFLDRAADISTDTMRVRVKFPNPEKVLRPGLFGRISVDVGVRTNSVVIPERAVVELQGKNFVWVIGADHVPELRSIQVADTGGDGVLVLEGLKAGERIVVEGLQKVRKDVPVNPMTAAEMAAAAAAREAQAAAQSAAGKAAGGAPTGQPPHGKE